MVTSETAATACMRVGMKGRASSRFTEIIRNEFRIRRAGAEPMLLFRSR